MTNPVEQGKVLIQVSFIQEITHSHHYAETYLILTRCFHPFFQVFPKPRLVTADKSFSSSKLKRIAHRPAVDNPHKTCHTVKIDFHILVGADASQHHALQHAFFHIKPVGCVKVALPVCLGNPCSQFPQRRQTNAQHMFHPRVKSLGKLAVPIFRQYQQMFFDGQTVQSKLFHTLLYSKI